MALPDWNAEADVHRDGRYLRAGTFVSLIREVMAKKRNADRARYSTMVGDEKFFSAKIKDISNQLDFPKD
jgi:hypothetical protein